MDLGGCCLADGTCQQNSELACFNLGGSYRGADVSCDNYFCPSAPIANDDDVVLPPGGSVVLDVLANDIDVEGYGLSLASFEATSNSGGTITQEGDELRYTAPSGTGVDSFGYQVQSIFGLIAEGTVVIELTDALPGVQVEYYDLDALSELPDFGPLVPISAEVLPQMNLPSTNGALQVPASPMTSERCLKVRSFSQPLESGRCLPTAMMVLVCWSMAFKSSTMMGSTPCRSVLERFRSTKSVLAT